MSDDDVTGEPLDDEPNDEPEAEPESHKPGTWFPTWGELLRDAAAHCRRGGLRTQATAVDEAIRILGLVEDEPEKDDTQPPWKFELATAMVALGHVSRTCSKITSGIASQALEKITDDERGLGVAWDALGILERSSVDETAKLARETRAAMLEAAKLFDS